MRLARGRVTERPAEGRRANRTRVGGLVQARGLPDLDGPEMREWRPNSSSGPAHRGVDLTVEVGDVDVRMPRDRTGTFEPVTVPKHARRLDGVARNVILRSAKGMTTRDIQARLAEIYDTEISRETISKIRDRVATRDATLART